MMTSRSLAFFALLMMVSTPLCAEVAPGGAPAVELETTARALERSKSRERVLRGETAALARDEQALARELIEAAAHIRARSPAPA